MRFNVGHGSEALGSVRCGKRKMQSSGMLHRVALVRTDVSEERIASIIRVTRIDELGTLLAVTSNRSTLRLNNIL
jgi:hypothetical protein